ncbi:hypothetical protein POJ06DRAFT_144168 [Lipomyces tetrasporus]|uniref:Uncharacterized protein n=1 Tax=Lipomyces tetrasporus TaxID=54092 RepID=A0AAD7VRQ2_9ASCO|nr:uncharacterized protein POJ06DRAFT_144168 [Lipomyces tetrasporus]KAJ8098904.1 hypothetical protein POJ06DRAFT_144168 [Lipomyces tetrasporus]
MPVDTRRRLQQLRRRREEEEDAIEDAVVIAIMLEALGTANVRRNRFYFTRPVLLSPKKSPWQILRDSCDEKAFFILTTGLSPTTFNYVLDCGFRDAWDKAPVARDDVSAHSEARPHQRSLDADGALGLVLHFLNSSMTQFTLQEVFGIVPSVCSSYLQHGLELLLKVLKTAVPDATIAWPKMTDLQRYASLIRNQHPMLENGFGYVDRLHLPVQPSSWGCGNAGCIL